ncbi:hypothetical protein [Bradyrhizobium cenepequi]
MSSRESPRGTFRKTLARLLRREWPGLFSFLVRFRNEPDVQAADRHLYRAMPDLHRDILSDDAFPEAMLATMLYSVGALVYWLGDLLALLTRS